MRLSWLALLVPAMLALAGGTIIAAHAGDGTTTRITACARLKDGRLRVSPPEWPAGTRNARWNGTSRASAASPGEPGPVGATGAAGSAGRARAWVDLPRGSRRPRMQRGRAGRHGHRLVRRGSARRDLVQRRRRRAGPGIKVNEFSTGVTGAATNEFVELVNAARPRRTSAGSRSSIARRAEVRTRRSRRFL